MSTSSGISKYADQWDLLGTRRAARAEKSAKASQAEQKEAIGKQKQLEATKLAEEEDLLGRKKQTAKAGGRSLLTATSPTGTNTNLGGTA